MLNKALLAQAFEAAGHHLFSSIHATDPLLVETWNTICNNSLFAARAATCSSSWSIPSWYDILGTTYAICSAPQAYAIHGIDGSQIYTDRHTNITCALINIGTISIQYGTSASCIRSSYPTLLLPVDDELDGTLSVDFINGKRQGMELAAGTQLLTNIAPGQQLLLFDGSLIFWHLETKSEEICSYFLGSYLQHLQYLYSKNIYVASYISFPKSRELINLIRLALCDFDTTRQETTVTERAVDSSLLRLILQSGVRTQVFKNHASVSSYYLPALHPHFFYINTGWEIGRVELPAYLAQDNTIVDYIAACILDQCTKGDGYPVILAEAHEQAVVKSQDREWFYHLLQKLCFEYKHQMRHSIKSLKKRSMRI